MDVNRCTADIIGAAMQVHTVLGPGLLENPYHLCLAHELRKRGRHVVPKQQMPIVYDGVRIDSAYQADLVVDRAVIVEVKAVRQIHPVHIAQLLSYLKLSGLRVGLLINFHELHLRDGIRRLVN